MFLDYTCYIISFPSLSISSMVLISHIFSSNRTMVIVSSTSVLLSAYVFYEYLRWQAAVGILTYAQQHLDVQLKESWYTLDIIMMVSKILFL